MAFLLTILSLLLSWAAAFLFAVLTTHLAFASGLTNIPVLRVFRPQEKQTCIKGLQKIICAFLWIEQTLLISRRLVTSDSLPVARDFIVQAIRIHITTGLMNAMLNDFVLILGLFVIFQLFLAVNKLFPHLDGLIERWGT